MCMQCSRWMLGRTSRSGWHCSRATAEPSGAHFSVYSSLATFVRAVNFILPGCSDP